MAAKQEMELAPEFAVMAEQQVPASIQRQQPAVWNASRDSLPNSEWVQTIIARVHNQDLSADGLQVVNRRWINSGSLIVNAIQALRSGKKAINKVRDKGLFCIR